MRSFGLLEAGSSGTSPLLRCTRPFERCLVNRRPQGFSFNPSAGWVVLILLPCSRWVTPFANGRGPAQRGLPGSLIGTGRIFPPNWRGFTCSVPPLLSAFLGAARQVRLSAAATFDTMRPFSKDPRPSVFPEDISPPFWCFFGPPLVSWRTHRRIVVFVGTASFPTDLSSGPFFLTGRRFYFSSLP